MVAAATNGDAGVRREALLRLNRGARNGGQPFDLLGLPQLAPLQSSDGAASPSRDASWRAKAEEGSTPPSALPRRRCAGTSCRPAANAAALRRSRRSRARGASTSVELQPAASQGMLKTMQGA